MASQSNKNLITVKNDWQHSKEYSKLRFLPKVKHLFETAALSDCEFIVEGKTTERFRAHKLLLAMRFSVFKTMFYGSMPEENSIKITDMEPEIFRKILEYIYTGTIKLTSFDEGCHVYIGAKKYMLDSLCAECGHLMCSLLHYYKEGGYIPKNILPKYHLKNYLLKTGEMSDCEFIVEGETTQRIRAHKLLLAMNSAVFETMFYGSMPEENYIKITDIEPEIFRTILEYIYTDTIDLTSFDEASHVYIGAKKYMLDSLKTDCLRQMYDLIKISNSCKAYKFAKFVEEPDLLQRCVKIFSSDTTTILQTHNYEDISLDVLKVISEKNYLNIPSELVLFNALEKCVEQNISKSDSHNGVTYQDVLKNIRFLTLSPQEFAKGPANSPLLTENQKYLILKCTSLDSILEVPEGFSQLKTRRKLPPCGFDYDYILD